MPSVTQLAKLFRAISTGDLSSAHDIADDLARNERRKGHHTAAQLLAGSLKPNGMRGHGDPQLAHELHGDGLLRAALSQRAEPTRLNDVMMSPECRSELQTVIKEMRHAAALRSKGIRRRSKMIFTGPPGCGKSLTGQAIANELRMPLYVVRFDAVIGAYLGQTAAHLRELFRFAAENACVLLFDEIDALGKRRGNPLDVGELDRIVISLMQELELSETRGIIIATSNLPQNLDPALWRRFDLAVLFPAPKKHQLRAFITRVATRYHLRLTTSLRKAALGAASYADAEKLIEAAARTIVLSQIH